MQIYFTKHARAKLIVLKRHNFTVSLDQIKDTITNPELIDESRLPLLIAQKSIDLTHVLRVVYKQESDTKIVITFYPGRKKQYE